MKKKAQKKTHWGDWEIWGVLAALSPILGMIGGGALVVWVLKEILTIHK